ncbi:MAG: endonuclease III [Anaerolineae bacterium]
MEQSDLPELFKRLREAAQTWTTPIVSDMARHGAAPFEILIASLLSARTLDTVTAVVAPRLFALARTPEQMIRLHTTEIEKAIHGVAFSETKSKQILRIAHILLDEYNGQVPDDLERLDALPGVGRKIANLVITDAFNKPGICVDTHVHRITNRWGYMHTKTPDETELALREKLPPRYWLEINALLVALGQNICRPTTPNCSHCPVYEFCERVGVSKQR